MTGSTGSTRRGAVEEEGEGLAMAA
jgi:hypothetical protein